MMEAALRQREEVGSSREAAKKLLTDLGIFHLLVPIDTNKINRAAALIEDFPAITSDQKIKAGHPCIRDTQITVGTIIDLLGSGHAKNEIIEMYPELKSEDIEAALSYAGALL